MKSKTGNAATRRKRKSRPTKNVSRNAARKSAIVVKAGVTGVISTLAMMLMAAMKRQNLLRNRLTAATTNRSAERAEKPGFGRAFLCPKFGDPAKPRLPGRKLCY